MENFFTTSLTKDPAMPSPACWKTTAGQGEKRETPLALGRSLARYGLGIIYWTSCNPNPKDPTLRRGLRLVRRNLTIKVSCRQKRLAGRAFFRCCSSNGCRPRFNHNHLGIIHKFVLQIFCVHPYITIMLHHIVQPFIQPRLLQSHCRPGQICGYQGRRGRKKGNRCLSRVPCKHQKNNYSKTPRPPIEPTAL